MIGEKFSKGYTGEYQWRISVSVEYVLKGQRSQIITRNFKRPLTIPAVDAIKDCSMEAFQKHVPESVELAMIYSVTCQRARVFGDWMDDAVS